MSGATYAATVMASEVGNMLLACKDGGLQYLWAGARGNIGCKSGRYAFEVTSLGNS